MMPLGTDLTRQFQRIDDLLFASLHLLQCISALDSHLKVEANHFDDLFVSCREANMLFRATKLAFALNDELDNLIFGHDRLDDELSVFVTVLDVLRCTHCRFDFSLHVTHGFYQST